MAAMTEDMQRVVREQRLAYVATVTPDGMPNLSPKGTIAVWDDEHLVFADIRSPRTVNNLRLFPAVEINVVDPILRKGYRFQGTATTLHDGPLFEQIGLFYHDRGVRNPIRSIVLIKVDRAMPLISPVYDLGLTEDEVRARWQRHWESLAYGIADEPTGE